MAMHGTPLLPLCEDSVGYCIMGNLAFATSVLNPPVGILAVTAWALEGGRRWVLCSTKRIECILCPSMYSLPVVPDIRWYVEPVSQNGKCRRAVSAMLLVKDADRCKYSI